MNKYINQKLSLMNGLISKEINMIIEASQINSNGGVVLLELLLKRIETLKMCVCVYVSYDSVYQKVIKYQSASVTICRTSLFGTFFRYINPRKRVLYFCNLPPFIRNEQSILYIHNLFFVSKPTWSNSNSDFGLNLRKFVYYPWIKLFAKNVTTIACQTPEMNRLLKDNLTLPSLVLPFFGNIKIGNNSVIKEYDFFYPGSSSIHKNNRCLLLAIEEALTVVKFRVLLTLDSDLEVLNKIDVVNQECGYQAIVNVGLISHEEVMDYYLKSKALLFPSLKESFGLPLIEAVQSGILVMSSDLPFSYDVLENPITFDPNDFHSIANKIIEFMQGKYDRIEQKLKMKNQLDTFLDFFK